MPKRRNKILLVDDDEDLSWAVNALLTMKNFDVDVSKDGMDAIKKTRQKNYNLAIIDIRLPDMEGIELLKRLEQVSPKMRKIIMTGYATKDNVIQAMNYGADLFLTKPVDLQDFLRAIDDQLEKQRRSEKVFSRN